MGGWNNRSIMSKIRTIVTQKLQQNYFMHSIVFVNRLEISEMKAKATEKVTTLNEQNITYKHQTAQTSVKNCT